MSDIPGVNEFSQDERPFLATREPVAGAYWSLDWRDIYPVASDRIHNHDQPAYLGVLDGTESVTDWNPWEGVCGPHPDTVIRYGYGPRGLQEHRQAAPLAIDSYDRNPDHGQARLSGVGSIAGLVPFLELPDAGIGTNDLGNGYETPYHFDWGLQMDMASAIGPRQIFREPPSYGDQSAAIYAAGL